MYKQYYGLQRNPFELTPDSEVLFLSEVHKEGLATLKYGIISNKGFLLLTGGVGTGKTTLINVLVKSLKPSVKVCVLSNPILAASEFLYFLASKLGLPNFENKVKFLQDFSEMLQKSYEDDSKILVIIDEAHVLPVELLEEIRLLSNLSGDGHNVLSIFLVGQPELLDRLAHERLLPLRQRIGIRFHLDTFTREDTEQYIHFRLNKAGAVNTGLFSEEAVRLIHLTTHGNPRLINILSDHALLSGFAQEKLTVDEAIITECVNELHLPGDTATFDLLPLSQDKGKKKRLVLVCVVLSLMMLTVIFVFPDQLRSIGTTISKFLYKH
ncbi:MAG: AAA family ATPase [Desulfocapsaceae bacterium]|nr:AAA family ATPase [Desulfocapsaceae bacterium]